MPKQEHSGFKLQRSIYAPVEWWQKLDQLVESGQVASRNEAVIDGVELLIKKLERARKRRAAKN